MLKRDGLVIGNVGLSRCHLYFGGQSKAHCLRLLNEVMRRWGEVELTKGWLERMASFGCWGNPMEGIDPQVGVWVTRPWNEKPKRLPVSGG